MARSRNSADTVLVTVSTTPLIKALLEELVRSGFYGKNGAEAADRLLSEKLRELLEEGSDLSLKLREAQRNFLAKADNVES